MHPVPFGSTAQVLQDGSVLTVPEVFVKLSIKAELAYSFADATQISANIEASDTSDQSILSETLDIQPPAKILSDKSPYGDRRIRARFTRRSIRGARARL
jgi:hypothetical protein